MAIGIMITPVAKGFLKQQLALKGENSCSRIYVSKIG